MCHRPAGSQHGIEDDHRSARKLARQRLQIRHRHVGFLVAGDADESRFRVRYRGVRGVEHAQPGPQHRHQQRRLDQARPDGRGYWGANLHRLSRRIPAGLVDQHQRQLTQRGAKAGVIGAFVTQYRQPGGGQRMVDDANFHVIEGI
ncbi:hypothetical protein A5753_11075 [Mycobacterium sp. 852002-51971_SCH5477799-a]|nr:hypothetical protein A5753_11075 [Mycobacterium sp. 852002-51971_SCH5477799-a]